MPKVKSGARSAEPWETWELQLLCKEFPAGNLNQLARDLQRGVKAIECKARDRLGLKRDKKVIRDARSAASAKGKIVQQQMRALQPREPQRSFGHGVTDLERAWRGLPL